MLTEDHTSGLPAGTASPRTRHAQLWFGRPERRLHGWLSTPSDGLCRGAVVLCPPLGHELLSAHRSFRRLAEELAAAGFAALRFDYDGTGDSAGGQEDPARVRTWLDSIAAARAELTARGAARVAVVGMRLGATLAAVHAAEADERPAALVLWDPCRSGRTFLREGEALLEVAAEASSAPRDPAYRHTPGFQYAGEVATDLRGVDLAGLPPGTPLAERVLLLTREDRPDTVGELLAGQRPTHLPATGQGRLLDVPVAEAFVPEDAIASIVAWLGEDAGPARPIDTADGPRTAELEIAGRAVTERSRWFGAGLYGIVTEPAGASAATRPWFVLVNVAAEHRIGPGRRWVDLARAWAAQGHRSVRLDLSGVGDSITHPGQVEARPFAPAWIDDLPQVVDELRAGGAPVALIGLCSGAYSALEASQWTTVDAVFAVNPRLTLHPAAKGTPMYDARRRAAIVPAVPVTWVAPERLALAGRLWRIVRQLAVWNAPARILHRVVRSGTRLEVVSCAEDHRELTTVAAWRWPLRRLASSGRFRIAHHPRLDHSLLTRTAQDAMAAEATRFVEEIDPPGDRDA